VLAVLAVVALVIDTAVMDSDEELAADINAIAALGLVEDDDNFHDAINKVKIVNELNIKLKIFIIPVEALLAAAELAYELGQFNNFYNQLINLQTVPIGGRSIIRSHLLITAREADDLHIRISIHEEEDPSWLKAAKFIKKMMSRCSYKR